MQSEAVFEYPIQYESKHTVIIFEWENKILGAVIERSGLSKRIKIVSQINFSPAKVRVSFFFNLFIHSFIH